MTKVPYGDPWTPARRYIAAGEWIEQAACRGRTDIFFPRRGANHIIAAARELCMTCPVRRQCGEWADANGEGFGIWAGRSRDTTARKKRKEGAA